MVSFPIAVKSGSDSPKDLQMVQPPAWGKESNPALNTHATRQAGVEQIAAKKE